MQIQEEEEKRKPKPREEEQKFECSICMDKYSAADALLLENCTHVFHQVCMAKFVKSETSENKFPIICPALKCKTELSPIEVMMFLTKDEYSKYTQHQFENSLGNLPNFSWCPTADCKNCFEFDPISGPDFTCDMCRKSYCLDCKTPLHKGQTCKENQIARDPDKNEAAFKEFVQGQKFKQCPFCGVWVERSAGCDHMTCKCKKEFCYVCGGVYKQCACVKLVARPRFL